MFSVNCIQTLKDNDVCLTEAFIRPWLGREFQWNEVYQCKNQKKYCEVGDHGAYKKDMYKCCPETCKDKMPEGNFTERSCRGIGQDDGTCTYPFTSRVEDCSVPGKKNHSILKRI